MTDTQTALEVSISRSDTVQAMRALKEAFSTRNDPQTRVYIEVFERLSSALQSRTEQEPIPVHIYCPECRALHLDEGEWATRPHKTHQCQSCGHEWRPFEFPTVGVAPPRTEQDRWLGGGGLKEPIGGFTTQISNGLIVN